MPDWTYQTVFRPLLFGLGPRAGRNVALGSMGLLSRLPFGKSVIQFMGHMRPDPRLVVDQGGFHTPTNVGLSCAFDPHLLATGAFAEFGFGFLEVGPIVAGPAVQPAGIYMDVANETVMVERPSEALTAIAARERLVQHSPLRLPVLARIEPESPEQAAEMQSVLAQHLAGWVVPVDRLEHCTDLLREGGSSPPSMVVIAVNASEWQDGDMRERCRLAVESGQAIGLVVVAPTVESSRALGKSGFVASVETVRSMRAEIGDAPLLIAAVGVHTPADALEYVQAGANLVQVDSGLAFAGPGLPKRINAAMLYRKLAAAPPEEEPPRWGTESWFWAMLMGLGMVVGGLLAMLIATTRVVLPYDEAMAGLTRDQLSQVNDRLLAFMTHDRVTLSGTMLAVGWIYVTLAWSGIRRGVHWALMAIAASAFAGFFSFFSFLGFGYFDPFHAFVTAVLFPFLLLMIHSRLPPRHGLEAPELSNDGRWRANLWGQLLFVIHGAILIVAGLIITSVGMSTVFVPEDLHFMDTTAEELRTAHPQLVPLVAHDRATFGGMLISCGMATFLSAMWGFQRGQAWLWWALMLGGTVAYGATILVHWVVGYDALMHLLPAYGGLALLWAGGLASYWYLLARDEKLEKDWEPFLVQAESPEG